MTPTKEEQIEFSTENSWLVDEMGKIIKSGPTIESITALNTNIAEQKKLWENYNKKYAEEVPE